MKILFLHNSLMAGGAERTIARLSNYFAGKGHKVTVLLTQCRPKHYNLHDDVNCIELTNDLKKSDFFTAVKNNLMIVSQIRKTFKKEKPDIIVCMNSSVVFSAILAGLFLKAKIIGSERSNPYVSMQGTIWFHLKKLASVFSDGYVFQTQRASEFYPASVRKKSCIIENAVDPLEIDNVYNYSSKKITAVGRLVENKGFHILIDAISKLPDEYQEHHLHIYGEGTYRKNLEELIEKKQLTNRVFLEGITNEVQKKIADSCVFVLSSFSEGMPNSLMEAMSLGIPCISADCQMGPAELIQSEINGILVPVGDSDALSVELLHLLSNRSYRTQISSKAKEINFTNSIDAIGGKWLDCFNNIVQKKK